jgi:hypothetical protein
MSATFFPGNGFEIVETLRQDHEDIRTELSRAIDEHGAVGAAAGRLAQLCLPHFEYEERVVFPVLARLRQLTAQDALPAAIKELEEQIAELSRQHKRFGSEHQLISTGVRNLLEAGHGKGSRHIVELAHIIRNHEGIEDDLDFSAHQLSIRPARPV